MIEHLKFVFLTDSCKLLEKKKQSNIRRIIPVKCFGRKVNSFFLMTITYSPNNIQIKSFVSFKNLRYTMFFEKGAPSAILRFLSKIEIKLPFFHENIQNLSTD